jgi:hypothetical protein
MHWLPYLPAAVALVCAELIAPANELLCLAGAVRAAAVAG